MHGPSKLDAPSIDLPDRVLQQGSWLARFLRAHWTLKLSFLIIIILLLFAVAAPVFAPYDPNAINLSQKFADFGSAHWLGTDHLGRDNLSRLIYGTRVSLGSVVIILSIVLATGIAVGGLAGFVGGKVDTILMRICEVFLTFPTFVLAMFFVGVLGVGMFNVIIAIALSHWAWYARIVRSVVLSIRNRDFILASQASGASRLRIFMEHVLPSVVSQIVVLATLDIGHMMLHVAGLSFLGLGIAAPTAEWGVMINDARNVIFTQPLLMVLPGAMLFITVMAFNRLGDALRDYLDPTLIADEHGH